MPNPNYAKGGGSWSNATNCYVKHNGSWVEADEGWKNVNGTWTKFYDKWPGTSTLQFYSTSSSVTEGNSGTKTHNVTVNRSGNTSVGTATVDYATANLTATAGSDYTAASGTLSFAANETSKTISITITCDTTVENNETFKITLSNPTTNDGDAALGSNTVHTVTITNDDVTGTTTTTTTTTTPAPTTTTSTTTSTTPEPTTTTTEDPGFGETTTTSFGGGGSLIAVTDCTSGTSYIIDDYNGMGPASQGEVVAWSEGAQGGGGDYHCGTVTSTSASGSSTGTLDMAGFFADCAECNEYMGF